MSCTTAWERTHRVRRRETAIAESHQTIRTWKHHSPVSSPAPLYPLQSSRVCPACSLAVTVQWRSDALTPCSCWHHFCLWDSTACSEPRQVEKCTGCPKVRSKVRFSKLVVDFSCFSIIYAKNRNNSTCQWLQFVWSLHAKDEFYK